MFEKDIRYSVEHFPNDPNRRAVRLKGQYIGIAKKENFGWTIDDYVGKTIADAADRMLQDLFKFSSRSETARYLTKEILKHERY